MLLRSTMWYRIKISQFIKKKKKDMCVSLQLKKSAYFSIQLIFTTIYELHCTFDTSHEFHYTISANFYLYLQYFQQNAFSFSKISDLKQTLKYLLRS